MIIRNSITLLEQLSEIEEKIIQMERVMKELKIDCDKDTLLELLVTCQLKTGRPDKNS